MRFTLFPLLLCALQAVAQDIPALPTGPAYGMHCGIVGAEPAPRSRLEALVLFKDTVGVLDMLNDSSLVIQAYGAEGVIRLQRDGVSFAQAVDLHVAELRSSNTPVWSCSGCLYGKEPLHSLLKDRSSFNNIR